MASGLLIGGIVGLIAGRVRRLGRHVLMRITDLFLALPGALVAIAIVAALGPGLVNTLIGVSIVWWPYYARIIRGEVRALAARPHVEAARLAGRRPAPDPDPRTCCPASCRPRSSPPASTSATWSCCWPALSFLGLGQQAPAPELGADTARALEPAAQPVVGARCPGLAVLLLTLIANLGGDAIRHLIPVRR